IKSFRYLLSAWGKKIVNDKYILILLGISLLVHLISFNLPREVVFDEVHFGTFVRSYVTGENHFDIHPPLGKLFIVATAKLGAIQLPEDLTTIGQTYNARDLFFLRVFPLLIGIFLPILCYLLMRELTKSQIAAFIAGLLIVFDNALLVQSRFAFLDIPLLFFGFASVWMFLLQERASSIKTKFFLLLATGFLFGISYSIKWTALAMIVPLGLLLWRSFWKDKSFHLLFAKSALILLASLMVYAFGFTIHFALLTKPGPGDAYLEQGFREKPFIEKVILLNKAMYSYNKSISTQHPYASRWNQWPFNQKPIYYWNRVVPEQEKEQTLQRLQELTLELQSDPQRFTEISQEVRELQQKIEWWKGNRQIWLVGNPATWFLGIFAVFAGAVLLALKIITRKPRDISAPTLFLLLASWAASFLPFTPIDRPLFLYHYFFPLLFSLLLAGYIGSWLISRFIPKQRILLSLCIIASVLVAGFLLTAPVSYGWSFDPNGWYHNSILRVLL